MSTYAFPCFPKPHPSRIKDLKGKKKVTVLSIDGGGIRGLIPAMVLERMEEVTGKRVAELFDVVAGTSTGGILSLMCALPEAPGSNTLSNLTTAKELVKVYKERGNEIFPQAEKGTDLFKALKSEVSGVVRTVSSAIGRPKYEAKGLEKLISEFCEVQGTALTLTDTVVPVYVTSVEVGHPWGTVFFSSLDARADSGANGSNYRLSDIARATSAAPTFLPPKRFNNVTQQPGSSALAEGNVEVTCIDGGVVCNNPSLAVLNYVRSVVDDDAEVVLVSLGTGRIQESLEYKDMCSWGAVDWIKPLISTMMAGSSALMHDQVETIAAGDKLTRYYRFQMVIPEEYTSSTSNKEFAKARVACEELDNVRTRNLDVMADLVRDQYLPEIDNSLGKALEDLTTR